MSLLLYLCPIYQFSSQSGSSFPFLVSDRNWPLPIGHGSRGVEKAEPSGNLATERRYNKEEGGRILAAPPSDSCDSAHGPARSSIAEHDPFFVLSSIPPSLLIRSCLACLVSELEILLVGQGGALLNNLSRLALSLPLIMRSHSTLSLSLRRRRLHTCFGRLPLVS